MIKESKGKYIAFLDSDDLWKKNKLEKQLNFMITNDIVFFYLISPISENGDEKYSIIVVPKEIDYHTYLKNTIIGCLTVIIDREKTGDFYMPNIRSSHDMAFGY